MRSKVPPDPRYSSIWVDANFFDDSIGPAERAAADTLVDSDLIIAVPHTVRREVEHPNTPPKTRSRLSELPYTLDMNQDDSRRIAQIRELMRGNAQPGKHDADASHLYDAALWQAGYFVTCDARILKRAPAILAMFNDLWVVRPSELVAIFEAAG